MQAENPQTHLQKKVQTFSVAKAEHGNEPDREMAQGQGAKERQEANWRNLKA